MCVGAGAESVRLGLGESQGWRPVVVARVGKYLPVRSLAPAPPKSDPSAGPRLVNGYRHGTENSTAADDIPTFARDTTPLSHPVPGPAPIPSLSGAVLVTCTPVHRFPALASLTRTDVCLSNPGIALGACDNTCCVLAESHTCTVWDRRVLDKKPRGRSSLSVT